MAANNSYNWAAIKETVEDKNTGSGNVKKYESDLREIMADGNEYTVGKLRDIMIVGYNAALPEGSDKIDVNWSTLKYTLTHKSGFRAVEGKDNTFVLDASVKRETGRKGRKLSK